MFKTLVAEVDGALTAGVVPVHTQLDLKALAMAVGGKKARMAEVTAAERATGYVAGGISPHGQRKRIPVVVDASAVETATIFCSAGRRGLEIEIGRPAWSSRPSRLSHRSRHRCETDSGASAFSVGGIAGKRLRDASDGSAPGADRCGHLADAPGGRAAATRPARDPGDGIGARVEAVVLDEQAGAGSLGRHGERDGRVQTAHVLTSRRPGDPQHLPLVEGEHLAVPGAAQAALPDRIAVDGEPVPGL